MIVATPADADEVWEKVARATVKGSLGYKSEINPAKGLMPGDGSCGNVECSVYVKDCSKRCEVKRVLLALQKDLGLIIEGGFKPQIFTDLGIDKANKWLLGPSLYSADEVLEW